MLRRGPVPFRHPLAAAVGLVAFACGTGGDPAPRATSGVEAHWSYRGADGPAAWGSLAAGYARCADGSAQSPIAIDRPAERPLPDLRLAYRNTAVEITDTGHTEQVTVGPGSSITLDGVAYELEQFHYHAPSEHSIEGRNFPVEFHFVHRAGDGTVAVVGLMAVEGPAHRAWEPILEHLPTGDRVAIGGLDLPALLPGDLGSTRYDGSLTTPPCREGVHWALLDTPIRLSRPQIAALTRHYAGNNRPHQPGNGRLVAHDSTRGD